MQIPVLTPIAPPSPPLANTHAIVGGRRNKKEPTTPLPLEFNLLGHYAREKDTLQIDVHLSLSYAI
jgi:hypothetical protein